MFCAGRNNNRDLYQDDSGGLISYGKLSGGSYKYLNIQTQNHESTCSDTLIVLDLVLMAAHSIKKHDYKLVKA